MQKNSIKFSIKVIPHSGKHCFVIDKSGILKAFLKNAPEKGKANGELILLFSRRLNIVQSDVFIVSGDVGRVKIIEIFGFNSYEDLVKALRFGVQSTIFS